MGFTISGLLSLFLQFSQVVLTSSFYISGISFSLKKVAYRFFLKVSHLRKIQVNNPTVVLEKTLESPLDCKEIRPVHPEGDQLWVFFGRTDAEAETPVLWPPHEKS